MSPANKTSVLANCEGSSGHQGVALLVTPSRLVKLLEAAQAAPGEVHRGARRILADMSAGNWSITGGRGDRVNVQTAGGRYTLRHHTVSLEIRSISS